MTSTAPEEKRVSWAELFFDLVFVLAITQVSGLLSSDHSWGGLLRALVVFVPVYWLWVGTSLMANLHDVDRPSHRLGLFGVALAGLFMALSVPQAYGDRGLVLAFAYLAGRLIFGLMFFRGALLRPSPYTISMYITGPLLVAGARCCRRACWTAGDARWSGWPPPRSTCPRRRCCGAG
ncbi:MAG TPA: low temperature requirement protein A [Kribbellaceae bacterium]